MPHPLPPARTLRVPLPRCLTSLRVAKFVSLLPPSPGPSGNQQSPCGGCAGGRSRSWMRRAAVPGANGRGQAVAALRAGWKLCQQQQGMLSLCHRLPSHLLPTRDCWCHAGCHSCHPCPAPEDTRNPGDNVDLGASGKDRRSFSCQANWELGSGFGRAEHVEKPLQGFPTGITGLVAAVAPGCVADGACGVTLTCLSLLLPCLSHRGAGTWGPAPTAHPCHALQLPHALAPQQRRGCSCSLQLHSLGNWGTPTPILRATVTLRS